MYRVLPKQGYHYFTCFIRLETLLKVVHHIPAMIAVQINVAGEGVARGAATAPASRSQALAFRKGSMSVGPLSTGKENMGQVGSLRMDAIELEYR